MVVGDVSIVDDRHIRGSASPERLRVAQIHDRFGAKTSMSDAVGARKCGDMMLTLEQMRRSYFFRELHRMTDAEHFDAFAQRLNGSCQRGQVDFSREQKAHIDAAAGEIVG